VEVPIYRLAPHATAANTVPAMADLVEALMERAGPGNVAVMGDSAGGGLSLAVAQELHDRGGAQPVRIILIAPWLDASVSDPRQRELDVRDRMLGVEGLAACGRLYAGELDLRDPRVSPLFGDLRGLAPMTVFCGTEDILHPDALALVDRLREAGVDVEYHEGRGMQHDYPLLPLIPEGRAAREVIVRRVRG
jgi:acetyl esterase/lipase